MGYPIEYPAYTPCRELKYAAVSFNAAATPALVADPARLLDTATPITDLGAGQYRLNFRKNAVFPQVYAVANMRQPAAATDRAWVNRVQTSVAGDQQLVDVYTEVGGANDDPATAKLVDVMFFLGKVSA